MEARRRRRFRDRFLSWMSETSDADVVISRRKKMKRRNASTNMEMNENFIWPACVCGVTCVRHIKNKGQIKGEGIELFRDLLTPNLISQAGFRAWLQSPAQTVWPTCPGQQQQQSRGAGGGGGGGRGSWKEGGPLGGRFNRVASMVRRDYL